LTNGEGDAVNDFARRLRRLREAQEVTSYWLAQATGLSKQGALNLEMEDADPKLSTILKFATALGVSPHDFLPPRSGEEVNVRDAVSLARHLLPTAREMEKEARKERVYFSGFAVGDLAGRIRGVLEAVEGAAALARAVLPDVKATIKEAKRDRVMVSLPQVVTHAEAVVWLLQDAAGMGGATPVDQPKGSIPVDHTKGGRREPPAGRRGQESTRVDRADPAVLKLLKEAIRVLKETTTGQRTALALDRLGQTRELLRDDPGVPAGVLLLLDGAVAELHKPEVSRAVSAVLVDICKAGRLLTGNPTWPKGRR
jgi:transcriptional regulator with XRE-family HTH domain